MDVGLLVDSSLWWNASSWLASLNLPWPEPPGQFGRVREKELETRRGIALPIAAQEADIFSLFSSLEAFVTVLMQVEGCLNSRPITPISTDPNDIQVLTPGHFLIERLLNALPQPDYTVVPENRLRMWERLQRYTLLAAMTS
ncbi:uncharacterized protein LOC131696340 [Topomyia yanbarensis]|uniref:uncharacterized protein LOC131696340 n=1 Tax=Topomyia yanbarensis TaxID=2498891 RepID=UPI00273BE90A|nr:uncharacterized protein LOC131696340 [Topomyia yanbarensis]